MECSLQNHQSDELNLNVELFNRLKREHIARGAHGNNVRVLVEHLERERAVVVA